MGVPHPPGYPSYTLLAWLAIHLPVGPSIAYRVNLLSALSAACGAGLVCMCAQVILPPGRGRCLAAAVAALALGFAPLVWSQAVIAEVYAPALCFASLSLLLALRWREGGADHLLWASALAFGLSLGIHLTLALAAPPALAMLWPQRKRWWTRRTLLPTIALFASGVCVFAYLPLAAMHSPPINWGDPERGDRFLWMATGRLYHPMVLGLPVSEVGPRLRAWARPALSQFGWPGWAVALLGFGLMCKRDRALALSSIAWLAGVATFSLLYDSSDSFVYTLPALVAPALWLGLGAEYLLKMTERPRWWGNTIATALLLLQVVSAILHWREVDLSSDKSAELYARTALEAVASHGLAIVQGDQATFALWYAIYADGQRQDIAVVNTHLLGFDWYRDVLRSTYPDLNVTEPSPQSDNATAPVRELVVRNYLERPAFALDPSSEWLAWFDIVQQGDAPVFSLQARSRWEQSQ